MKKLDFLLLCLVTAYLAGMYRYLPLMVLSNLAFVFLIASFFLSCYFRKNLSVKLLLHSGFVEKAAVLTCNVKVENTGKLPVGRFKVRLCYGYGQEKQKTVKYMYGGCEKGENLLHFDIVGSGCGMMHLNMNRLYAYDYLSLFSASKKMREEIKIAVFPQKRELQVELPSIFRQESYLPQEALIGRGGDAHNEIRQLREYRRGDTSRFIHWNQSARTQQLWVKEFERETDDAIPLYLELKGIQEAESSDLDGFYELLSALVLGLLKKVTMLKVTWYHEGQKRFVDMEVCDTAQCREMMLVLYRMEEEYSMEIEHSMKKNARKSGENVSAEDYSRHEGFRLDLDLGWYWKEALIFRFSLEELEDQIAHNIFVV